MPTDGSLMLTPQRAGRRPGASGARLVWEVMPDRSALMQSMRALRLDDLESTVDDVETSLGAVDAGKDVATQLGDLDTRVDELGTDPMFTRPFPKCGRARREGQRSPAARRSVDEPCFLGIAQAVGYYPRSLWS